MDYLFTYLGLKLAVLVKKAPSLQWIVETITDLARTDDLSRGFMCLHQGPLLLTWFNFNPSMDM